MSKIVFYTDKKPVSMNYVRVLSSPLPLIGQFEIAKKTDKGYRAIPSYKGCKGRVYLESNYCFFDTYKEALEFVAQEANRVAGKLEELKLKAIKLMCEAQDELRTINNG